MTLAAQKKKADKEVEKFNSTYKVGDKIKVRQDDGSILEWTTRHEATVMGGHSAVIWVEEHRSAYAAERVVYDKAKRGTSKPIAVGWLLLVSVMFAGCGPDEQRPQIGARTLPVLGQRTDTLPSTVSLLSQENVRLKKMLSSSMEIADIAEDMVINQLTELDCLTRIINKDYRNQDEYISLMDRADACRLKQKQEALRLATARNKAQSAIDN